MESLTIKEIADLAGVTKPAIRYKADKLGIELEKDDSGKVIIKPENARKIIDSFSGKELSGDSVENTENNSIEMMRLKHEIELLNLKVNSKDELINNLRNELADARADLKAKDELIKQSNQQLATLADQAQRLQLKQIEAPRSSFWSRFFRP